MTWFVILLVTMSCNVTDSCLSHWFALLITYNLTGWMNGGDWFICGNPQTTLLAFAGLESDMLLNKFAFEAYFFGGW